MYIVWLGGMSPESMVAQREREIAQLQVSVIFVGERSERLGVQSD